MRLSFSARGAALLLVALLCAACGGGGPEMRPTPAALSVPSAAGDPAAFELLGPLGAPAIVDLAPAPVGSLVALATTFGFEIWDTAAPASGYPALVRSGGAGSLRRISWAPDGERLATLNQNGALGLWAADGTLFRRLEGHVFPARALAWSPAGDVLVSGAAEGELIVWNADGSIRATFLNPGGERREIERLAWEPRGQSFAALDTSGALTVWTPDGKLVREIDADNARELAWAPAETGLLATMGREIELWRRDGTRAAAFKRREKNPSPGEALGGVAWHPDGQILASADGSRIWLWDRDGQEIAAFDAGGHFADHLGWSADGELLLARLNGRSWAAWSADGTLVREITRDSGAAATRLQWLGDGRLLSSDYVGNVLLWRADGALDANLSREGVNSDFAVLSPDGKRGASLVGVKRGLVWQVGAEAATELAGMLEGTVALAWRPDGALLASATGNGDVQLWSPDGALLRSLDGQRPSHYWTKAEPLAWSPDGSRLAASWFDPSIGLWDLTGEPKLTRIEVHTNSTRFLAWHPGGAALAIGAHDGSLSLWHGDGAMSALLERVNPVDAAWHPAGQRLAILRGDGPIELRGADGALLETWGQPVAALASQDQGRLAWSPDGRTLAAADLGSNAINLWDERGALIAALPGHGAPLTQLAWSPDGAALVSADADGVTLRWGAR
ncbi:MAG TPA: WD40 repeat domain-containing protein [Herpetosiphonaceae bacterium]